MSETPSEIVPEEQTGTQSVSEEKPADVEVSVGAGQSDSVSSELATEISSASGSDVTTGKPQADKVPTPVVQPENTSNPPAGEVLAAEVPHVLKLVAMVFVPIVVIIQYVIPFVSMMCVMIGGLLHRS